MVVALLIAPEMRLSTTRLEGKRLPAAHAERRLEQVDNALGVAPVDDGEAAAQAEVVAVLAQEDVGGGMEGAAHHPAAALAGQLAGAPEHLLGGPAGEGEQQDGFRRHVLLEQVGHAKDQGAGLAAAGAGDDQERTRTVGDGGILGGVEHLGADRGGGRGSGLFVAREESRLHRRSSTTAAALVQCC